MGKKGAKSSGKLASTVVGATKLKEIVDENPDPKSSKFFNDEVDDYHAAREKVLRSNLCSTRRDSSDEELYKVAVDTDDDGEFDENDDFEGEEGMEENDDSSDDQDENVLDDMQSDIEDEEGAYLPSADAWGKKKKSFYSTDYVDKDYGGYLSESDEEAAKLEEIEAKALQKKMAENMTEEDFELFIPPTSSENAKMTGQEIVAEIEYVDLSTLDEDKKRQYLARKHPEFMTLFEELREKKRIVEQLTPIIKSIKNGHLPNTPSLQLIQLRYEAYCNYVLNIQFYLLQKAKHVSLKNHPIFDRIMEWKKIMTIVDNKCQNLMDDISIICEKLSISENETKNLEFVSDRVTSSTSVVKLKKRKLEKSSKNEEEGDLHDFEGEEDTKRAATYQILKNKGTTPRRKKENRNPRVKHRRKFDKALHKKRSQVPDVRRELTKYGGEIRGIKPNVVKSVKLH